MRAIRSLCSSSAGIRPGMPLIISGSLFASRPSTGISRIIAIPWTKHSITASCGGRSWATRSSSSRNALVSRSITAASSDSLLGNRR